MRISIAFTGLALALTMTASFMATTTAAQAAGCADHRLGTSRVIEVDTSRYREFLGKEKSLGLRDKELILTFDDGPIAGKTPRILDTLQRECVKATFFYVGRMARVYPKLVRRVVNEGHTLAHHTWGHNRLPQFKSASARRHIDRGISKLQSIAYGTKSTTPRIPFFRYPYLARNKRTDAIVRAKGMVAFGANIDSLDWKRTSPDTLHNRLMQKIRQQGRGIVLLHDIQARTAKMLPRLLRSLKAEGYKIVHMVPKDTPKPEIERVPDTMVVASAALTKSASPVEELQFIEPQIATAPKAEAPIYYAADEQSPAMMAALKEAEILLEAQTYQASVPPVKKKSPRKASTRKTMQFAVPKSQDAVNNDVAEQRRKNRANSLFAALGDETEQSPQTHKPIESVVLARVEEEQLRPVIERRAPSAVKKKRKTFRVVPGDGKKRAKRKVRSKRLAKGIVKRGNWTLRRSQWIIN